MVVSLVTACPISTALQRGERTFRQIRSLETVSVSNAKRPITRPSRGANRTAGLQTDPIVRLSVVLKVKVNLVIIIILGPNNRCVASLELPSPDAKVATRASAICMPKAMRPVFLVTLAWVEFFSL